MKEENSIGKLMINFIFAFFLFLVEIILLLQINLSRGLKQEEVIKLIDNLDIQTEIKKLDSYQRIKADENTLNKIFNSKEMNTYIKENMKSIYKNIFYNEPPNYIEKSTIEQFINEQLKQIEQETIGIEEQDILPEQTKNEIQETVKKITTEIDEKINEIEKMKKDINIIQNIFAKKTTIYILIIVLVISFLIILINNEKSKFFWIGIPTIITGILYLITYLTIIGKINEIGIDPTIQGIIIKLPKLLDKIKVTSITTIIIGLAFCAIYIILNYQEMRNEQNGKNKSIQI